MVLFPNTRSNKTPVHLKKKFWMLTAQLLIAIIGKTHVGCGNAD